MAQMYCLNCFYNLRGLTENRCPECGRSFSPSNASSFSRDPTPQTFRKLIKRASGYVSEAANAVEFGDPRLRATLSLRRQIGRLSSENWELRQAVAALTKVLLDNHLIDPERLAEAEQAVVMGQTQIIEDADDKLPELEPITLELLELESAVDRHDAEANQRAVDGH